LGVLQNIYYTIISIIAVGGLLSPALLLFVKSIKSKLYGVLPKDIYVSRDEYADTFILVALPFIPVVLWFLLGIGNPHLFVAIMIFIQFLSTFILYKSLDTDKKGLIFLICVGIYSVVSYFLFAICGKGLLTMILLFIAIVLSVPLYAGTAYYRVARNLKPDGTKAPIKTVVVEDELYLVACRHSSTEWILLPCEITVEGIKSKLEFINDKYLIKSLSGLMVQEKDYSYLRRVEAFDVEMDNATEEPGD